MAQWTEPLPVMLASLMGMTQVPAAPPLAQCPGKALGHSDIAPVSWLSSGPLPAIAANLDGPCEPSVSRPPFFYSAFQMDQFFTATTTKEHAITE